MNTLKEDKNEYEDENERIKVYLKIKPSLASDKIFYNVSKDKKILSLLDNLSLDDNKKTKKIEVDKIFTNKDENSYLYEEIARNCVKNSLNGDNYTFVSYGDSSSEKHHLIIGTPDCYENINNRGIFPRLLESYINKIDSNEILSDTISLNLSYIMINENNLIDLTQLMGIEYKSLEKLSKEDYLKKYAKELKPEEKNNLNYANLLKSIKKTPVEKANDSLFFLLQTLNLFYKLEESSNHFLTWSYFIIILYITDNNGKTVSTISFIILPGNEILLYRHARMKSIVGDLRRDPISVALKSNAVEFYNTREDILDNLAVKNEENVNTNTKVDKSQDKKTHLKNESKREIKSKLFYLIGKLSFDVNNKQAQYDRKYVIIGSMFGNSGHITDTKETLYFMTLCKKLSGQKTSNPNRRKSFIDTNFFKEKLKAKNDQIYDLESKLKTQESKVNELNILMENKEENYKALVENYKVQIKSLKEELGFDGDIENLIKKNENSEDYEFAARIRNLTENNKLKSSKIEELKEQITQIETVIQQLRTLLDLKENDFTMLDIVRSVREAREKKRDDMKIRNKTGEKIEELQKKNKILENKINGIKDEINMKKNIINGLPEIFNNNMNIQKNLEILETKTNDNEGTNKWFDNNNNEIINRIKTESNKEKYAIINKYENILNQNKNSIINQDKKLNNITSEFKAVKNKYLAELVLIYKSIINIINDYRKVFYNTNNIFINKEKFDKILMKEEKTINPISFPLLYNELGKIGYGHFQLNKRSPPSKKVIKSKYYKNTFGEDDINSENNKNEKDKLNYLNKTERNKRLNNIFDIIFKENNLNASNDLMLPLNKEMVEKKEMIFSKLKKKTDSQLINMDINEIIQYCKNNMKKMSEIENFINTYFKGKIKFDNFDPAKEREEEINKKIISINNNIQILNNKYNNNNVLFQKGDKIIQDLRNENNLLKKKIAEKNKNKALLNTKTQAINQFNKTKSQLKAQNLYHSILTATSSNNTGNNNLFILDGTKGFSDINSTRGTNEKIDFNLTENNFRHNNFEVMKKRPISSINKINPYFLVVDNL